MINELDELKKNPNWMNIIAMCWRKEFKEGFIYADRVLSEDDCERLKDGYWNNNTLCFHRLSNEITPREEILTISAIMKLENEYYLNEERYWKRINNNV